MYFLQSFIFANVLNKKINKFERYKQRWCVILIRWESDYIIGLDTPVIGPNKSKKLTRLIALSPNTRGKFEL